MDGLKINRIMLNHFRGIPNELSLSFCLNEKPESVIIFGDNGSGKSSIVDAIEFVTLGEIQGARAGNNTGWIYNSVSLEKLDTANVEVFFDNGEDNRASFKRDIEQGNAVIIRSVVESFRYAPFILRRMDILDFWSEQSIRKLMLFSKYVRNDISTDVPLDKEKEDIISQKRRGLKEKKRELIKSICEYYNLDPKEMSGKAKGDFFAFIRLLNRGKNLKQLNANHPQYDNLKELNRLYDEITFVNKEQSSLSKKIANFETTNKNQETWREKLKKILIEISPSVTEAFIKISRTADFVKEIKIFVANQTEVSLDFKVELNNGEKATPFMLFSEANRDLLALLIYLEYTYHAQNMGQAKVLVLDDIFQSVDSTIRFRVMQYIVSRFSDWQLIITTHDRLWKEQLIQLFRNHNKSLIQYEIMNWSFRDGPRIVGSRNNYDERLVELLKDGSTADICAGAGYLLEYICEKLSCILSTSIKRRQGDRYTIGDLWPGVYKELKRAAYREKFDELNDLVYLRNMVGSHYNEWSLSLSRAEANDFAEAVLDVYYLVCCKKCGAWIKSVGDISAGGFEEVCCKGKGNP